MHELGIVFYIIDDVTRIARDAGATRVSRVTLEVGEVSGVVPELLDSAWTWACAREDAMRGCELACVTTPAESVCEDCGATYGTVEHGRTCPVCGSPHTHLLRGRDVMIRDIAVPDAPPA